MPIRWLQLTTLLKIQALFLAPDKSIPPCPFSDNKLKRKWGLHYAFILEQTVQPNYLFRRRLFFMTFGKLFQMFSPTLHAQISLFMRLLAFPKKVTTPTPLHSTMLLFQTELTKGPLRTSPSPHLDMVEFLRMRLVSRPPLTRTPTPACSRKLHSRMLTLPPLQNTPTEPTPPINSDLASIKDPYSSTTMIGKRCLGSLCPAKDKRHSSICRVPRFSQILVFKLSPVLRPRNLLDLSSLRFGQRRISLSLSQRWAKRSPSRKTLSSFWGRSMISVGNFSLAKMALVPGSLACIRTPGTFNSMFSVQSPVATLITPSGWTMQRALYMEAQVFEFCIEQILFLRGLAGHVDRLYSELEQIFKGASDDLVHNVSYYNMLRIEVQGLNLERKVQGKLQIEVGGSKSGKLVSDTIDAASPEWNPYFRVDCNHTDKLVFRVIAIEAGKAKELGVSELYCARFVKENRKKLNSEDPTQYSLDILDGQNLEGTLNTYVWFDPTLSFQGQFPQNISLSLNNFNDPLPVYMGKCGTSNAFSFLDEPTQGQYCKFSESIYRDHS